jgi:hypothetical protein
LHAKGTGNAEPWQQHALIKHVWASIHLIDTQEEIIIEFLVDELVPRPAKNFIGEKFGFTVEKNLEMQYPYVILTTYRGSGPLQGNSITVKSSLLKMVLTLSRFKSGEKTFQIEPFGYIVAGYRSRLKCANCNYSAKGQ